MRGYLGQGGTHRGRHKGKDRVQGGWGTGHGRGVTRRGRDLRKLKVGRPLFRKEVIPTHPPDSSADPLQPAEESSTSRTQLPSCPPALVLPAGEL